MKNWCEQTIRQLAVRSDRSVLGITCFFAMQGSLLVICSGGQAIWGGDSTLFLHDPADSLSLSRGCHFASEAGRN